MNKAMNHILAAALLAAAPMSVALAVDGDAPKTGRGGITVNSLNDALTLDELADFVAGPGIIASNPVFTGDPRAAGLFVDPDALVGFEAGALLSSGDVRLLPGNDSRRTSTSFREPGDPDLQALVGIGRNGDAAVLEFDFVPNSDTVSIDYVFGSEEYNEFVGNLFNDVFAFFINGTGSADNCAVLEDGSIVSINTVNSGQNADQYINNDPSVFDPVPFDIEPDGFTVVLTCQATVTPGAVNTAKLAIADFSDLGIDSYVLFDSLRGVPPQISGTKTADPADGTFVAIGDTITYTLTLDIVDGPISAEAVLTDTLDPGLTNFQVVSNPDGFIVDGSNPYTFTLPTGTPSGTYTIQYSAEVSMLASGSVGNNVVAAGGDDPDPECPSCTTNHPVELLAIPVLDRTGLLLLVLLVAALGAGTLIRRTA